MLGWLFWAGMLTFLLLKHRLPDKYGLIHLSMFWVVVGFGVIISIIFISQADWVTVPSLFKSVGV